MAIVKLDNNEIYDAASDATIAGGHGLTGETVKVYEGVEVTTDANVERVEFTRASNEYTFKATTTGIQVLFDGDVVANVQAGEKLVFADGSAVVEGSFNAVTNITTYTLGGDVVSTAGSGLTPDLSTAAGEFSSIAFSTAHALTVNYDGNHADNIYGSGSADVFTARLAGNANTLESGDQIHGGGGYDTLKAYVGNSQDFAILAETDSVEKVVIQAQAVSADSTDNNMSATNEVQIDAQLMNGVTWFEDNQSRADLLIEDVQTNSRLTTIAMVGTDPGHVDYGVYFNQHALTTQDIAPREMTLKIMDVQGADLSDEPLVGLPLIGFTVYLNDGSEYIIGGPTAPQAIQDAINNAHTYGELVAALNDAVDANTTAGADRVHFSLDGAFHGTAGTTPVYEGDGTQILVTFDNSADPSVGFTGGEYLFEDNSVPSEARVNEIDLGTGDTTLIQTNIVLDDVGQGNMGGDLVVGGMSVGDTDDCVGVEQFNVTVIRDSELQTLNSTNNKLQEIYVVNDGEVNGDLTITGVVPTGGHVSGLNVGALLDELANGIIHEPDLSEIGVNTPLPGTQVDVTTPTNLSGDQHNAFGLNDVRVFDASAMEGNVTISAQLTDSVVAKYMDLGDTQGNPADDNAVFQYDFGSGDDTLFLAISEDNLAAAGTASREDFDLQINGGAGNDNITTVIDNLENDSVDPTVGTGNESNTWYLNSQINGVDNDSLVDGNVNLQIDAGDGDDTVLLWGAGDWSVQLGQGDDVIYTDNSGATRAVWVLNTADQTSLVDRNIGDLHSDNNDSTTWPNSLIGTASVDVNFRGLHATATIDATWSQTAFTDLELNQAIKEAIENDQVLSHLLSVQDGPGNTLVITSLTDGVRVATDFAVSVVDDVSGLPIAMVDGSYASAFGTDGATTIVGTDSTNTSDNLLTGDTGNDLFVLGTDSAALNGASNDVVIYDAVGFGDDTIVNFTAGAPVVTSGFVENAGLDKMDFSALLTGDWGFFWNYAPSNDTAAEIIAIAGDDGAAGTSIVITTSADNVGTVWQVIDGVAAGDATASIIGTIDLADTAWGSLTINNFILS